MLHLLIDVWYLAQFFPITHTVMVEYCFKMEHWKKLLWTLTKWYLIFHMTHWAL